MEGRRPIQSADPGHPINRVIGAVQGPPRDVDRVLAEGDEVGSYRVVHAPGHSAGAVILFRESDRVAIWGDVIRNLSFVTGRQKLAEPPDLFTVDPAENRRSIRKLLELRPRIACPGHGPPLRDLEALERLVDSFE